MMSVLRVVEPGLFTTMQDLGRPHAIASGVSPGGAMDRFAHRAANLLVGNDPGAATLECTMRGPRLAADRACIVAVTGGDLDLRVNGESAQAWTGLELQEGDELSFGARRTGARAYIAVAGGLAGDRWLGSLSTNLLAGRGGFEGRPLRAGDVIEAEPPDHAVAGRSLVTRLHPDYTTRELGVIAGPHFDRLDARGRSALTSSSFAVSHMADRMGFRLDGAELVATGEEILSFGLVAGAVQVPSGGHPILLMADHQTAGGYPVVAVVVSASLPVAAQLAPGDTLGFAEVTPERAAELRHAQEAALASLGG